MCSSTSKREYDSQKQQGVPTRNKSGASTSTDRVAYLALLEMEITCRVDPTVSISQALPRRSHQRDRDRRVITCSGGWKKGVAYPAEETAVRLLALCRSRRTCVEMESLTLPV